MITPRVDWTGPTATLHLRTVDGAVFLFDDQGRMINGLVSLFVTQGVDDVVRVECELLPGPPPK